MYYFFIAISLFLFAGCSTKSIEPFDRTVLIDSAKIDDLVNIPQDIKYFTKNIDDNLSVNITEREYEKHYFSAWNTDKSTKYVKEIKWPFYTFKAGKSYGENLLPLKQSFFDKMYKNSNFDAFLTLRKKAITLKHLDIRAFPTIKPLLRNPSLAGEGFPFDYLQNSSISANKPVFASHYSKNREWVYIFSSFASGWVKTRDIVFLDKEQTDKWQKAQQIFLTKENISISDIQGNFLFSSKIGIMLPFIEESEKYYTVLVISSCKNQQPLYVKAKILKSIASKGILNFNKKNLNLIIGEVFKSNYGWGGMYGQRDCSSTIRDIFAPFGIWLPRNSYMQSKKGQITELKDLTDLEKTAFIKKHAIPFQTLLYKKGHIALYVGLYKNEIVILHNTWGIKTKKDHNEGRIIVGKTVFSTLHLGKEQKNYDKNKSILKSIESMNIITKD